jgi:hypothetical protein
MAGSPYLSSYSPTMDDQHNQAAPVYPTYQQNL